MIILNTGTAGAGKTLFTLWDIENRRKADNKVFYDAWVVSGSDESNPPLQRDVYYFNININRSKLPWIKLDKVEDWYTMPVGSIFFFDECQEAFPPLANSAVRDKYYTELSKHRHRGYDIYFVTQHPTFVDTYIRKNVELHNHYMRPFGAKMVNKHTWKGVKDACDKTRKDWYKSSEVHTHKFKLPNKLKALFILPFLLAVCLYFSYDYFNKKIRPPKIEPSKVEPSKLVTVDGLADKRSFKQTGEFDPLSFKTRIADLPWSAPRYDELSKPTIAPRIIGCVKSANSCKCYTQQITLHTTSLDFCNTAIERGIFQDFDDNKQSSNSKISEPSRISSPAPSATSTLIAEAQSYKDSGFNLPIDSPLERYHNGFYPAPSGNIYPTSLPPSKIMYGGK
jgi:zona occludens toxin